MKTLKEYSKNKPFRILQCDKNVGFMIMPNEDELLLTEQLLDNNQTYEKLNNDQTDLIIEKINNELECLYVNGNINLEIKNKLKITATDKCKSGSLRILPKVHKKEFSIRQIISCMNHPTKKLCIAIDTMINPFIKSIKHILKDSQQLLQECENLISKEKLNLCDFESLYTNIQPDHATEVIPQFFTFQNRYSKTF